VSGFCASASGVSFLFFLSWKNWFFMSENESFIMMTGTYYITAYTILTFSFEELLHYSIFERMEANGKYVSA
jgi:hypothetical protein